MAEYDFMTAFNKRYSEGGFDPRYQRNVAKRVAALSEGVKGIANKKRPNLKESGLGSFDPETGKRASKEQLDLKQQFRDYDAMREDLAGYLVGNNMYSRVKRPTMEQARQIVDDFARAQREQQYVAPQYSSTSETARSPMEQKTTAAAPMPAAPTEAPAKPEFDGSALASAMEKAPAVQPAEKAPTEAAAMESYKTIEAGQAPKATVVSEQPTAEVPEDRLMGLFRKTMGSEFDPKSRMDRSKLDDLRSFVSSNPDALNKSDTKIALDYYRSKA